jgi:hypothetical protein
MNAKWFVSGTSLALCCLAAPLANAADGNDVPKPGTASTIGVISEQKAAQVSPGLSKAQVKSLLGAPWRTVQYNDMDQLENEIWEYRGSDSKGPYRIHIEFDHHDIVRIVGKIPDNVAGGKGTPAKS